MIVRVLKISSLIIALVLIVPLLILALLPPPASDYVQNKTYVLSGVLLADESLEDRNTTSVEYISRGIHDWAGIVKSLVGIKGGNSNSIAYIKQSDFTNGIIDVDIYSTIKDKSLGLARGFAGIAFRVSEDLASYELVYIRPANGNALDEVRRSHALQYAAHPSFHFDVSRKENPGKYETGADIDLHKWANLRIEVEDDHATIFIDGNRLLEINDLKLGSNRNGGIALWAGVGTKAYFSNLKLSHKKK